MRRNASVLLLIVALTLVVSACGNAASPSSPSGGGEPKLAPESVLPDNIRNNAPPQVKEAYRFAVANPDVLKQYPCYCGCGSVGHMSNLDCYIKEVQAGGAVIFDDHAFG
jgi:hypothetical protein